MVARSTTTQNLRFGDGHVFSIELEASRLAYRHQPPSPAADFASDVRQHLAEPLDFPPLEMSVVPDDRIIIALDRHTPGAAKIIAAVWSAFEKRSVRPHDVVILQPASWKAAKLPDPRSALPKAVAKSMGWVIHDATDKKSQRYLASSDGIHWQSQDQTKRPRI